VSRNEAADAAGLAVLVGAALAAFLLVPDLDRSILVRPEALAIAAMFVIVPIVVALRGIGRRGTRFERALWCLFLAAMPTVYLAALRSGPRGAADVPTELAGQVVFGALAALGFWRSPYWLALGIGAHGLLWDAWHGDGRVVHDWYAIACLVFDVGAAIYVATQARAFDGPRGGRRRRPW
jgi:hypothetical protein